MKNFPIKICSLIILGAIALYALFLATAFSPGPFLSVAGVMAVAIGIYAMCLVLSPFITVSIYKGGRSRAFWFGALFAVLTSGSFYFLLPFFEVVSSADAACVAATFFSVLAYSSYHGVNMLKKTNAQECECALVSRGFSSGQINKMIFYKYSVASLLGDAHGIIGYILFIYLPAVVISRANVPEFLSGTKEEFMCALLVACAILSFLGAAGTLFERIIKGHPGDGGLK